MIALGNSVRERELDGVILKPTEITWEQVTYSVSPHNTAIKVDFDDLEVFDNIAEHHPDMLKRLVTSTLTPEDIELFKQLGASNPAQRFGLVSSVVQEKLDCQILEANDNRDIMSEQIQLSPSDQFSLFNYLDELRRINDNCLNLKANLKRETLIKDSKTLLEETELINYIPKSKDKSLIKIESSQILKKDIDTSDKLQTTNKLPIENNGEDILNTYLKSTYLNLITKDYKICLDQ